MSFAVPIILALALAASYYGHSDWSWQAYQHEQSSKSDTSDDSSKSDDSSSQKNKSGQKSKSGKSGRNAAAPKDRGDAGTPKRLE